jgi:Sec-independent protein secretion pathway component TatC
MPFFFFIKEIIYKIVYIILVFIFFYLYIIFNFKSIILFILNPIKNTKFKIITNKYLNLKNIDTYENNLHIKEDNIFLPTIEINMPFFSTSYLYIYISFFISLYLFIPFLLFNIKILLNPILKKIEKKKINFYLLTLTCLFMLNILINQYILINTYINYIFSHYYEFLFYEFDVDFQLLNYFKIYLMFLYLGVIHIMICVYTIVYKKKNSDIFYLVFLIIYLFYDTLVN